eukprot:1128840-Amphidinium_carterae.1
MNASIQSHLHSSVSQRSMLMKFNLVSCCKPTLATRAIKITKASKLRITSLTANKGNAKARSRPFYPLKNSNQAACGK